ncbi:sensor histidine kinase [Pelotalea chapellei]|uniref:histidine kinase n=1 Tax=Pelotalea chapellei TaxID=44671 RepID=A0ABS5UDC5_9BACT|nr:PAS domain-containing sensor histidine kinase [Pelotalea chapellei]MBT1073471.1 PAS domain-containing sensor histidine kinase [Pelotalea chapellei]
MPIDKEKTLQMNREELRRRAEERVNAKRAGLSPSEGEEATKRLVHELEVHHIELEMQNEELRQARDEVETALKRYADLYDFAPVGYCTLDHDWIIHEVNLTGASLLGSDRSGLVGRSFELRVSREDRQAFSAFLGTALDNRQKASLEVLLDNSDGQSRWVQIEALWDELGRECRLGIIDITERRRAQEELEEKRRELEELNKDLEARIATAVDDLRQKDQVLILQDRQAVMGEMIENIAHQWRQPLNTLGLVVQHLPLAHETGSLSKDFLDENVAMAMKVIQQMSRTIDDFRGFFRSDKKMTVFHLNEAISHTLTFVDKSFGNHKIGIAFNPEGDPVINGYPNEYAQVLLNILMNARDVILERHPVDAMITIYAFAEGERSVATIGDNAGGIAEEFIGKLFDPYFTTKGPDKGTGIGLYMSKIIIEKNMGGRLTVRNTDSGAEFRIEV